MFSLFVKVCLCVQREFIADERELFYEYFWETLVDENLRASNKTFYNAISQTDMQTSQILSIFHLKRQKDCNPFILHISVCDSQS